MVDNDQKTNKRYKKTHTKQTPKKNEKPENRLHTTALRRLSFKWLTTAQDTVDGKTT